MGKTKQNANFGPKLKLELVQKQNKTKQNKEIFFSKISFVFYMRKQVTKHDSELVHNNKTLDSIDFHVDTNIKQNKTLKYASNIC